MPDFEREPVAKVTVLWHQNELGHVLWRVYMHFYHSKRVSIVPGHFEQVYRRIYAYIKNVLIIVRHGLV